MAPPSGFEWHRRKNGEIAIRHHGREAGLVRGLPADRLVAKLTAAPDDEAVQHLLARATGNYRRGNERN